ncbi:MAG: ferritin [Anaerolineales bacterium]|nr:ferritin [Anaerolineales bacterium]
MIISKELEKAINQQIGNEFGASMQYLEIASFFEGENLHHFSNLFFDQAEEERDHAMKFLDFLLEVGAHVSIPQIEKSKDSFGSAEEAVNNALTWEKTVTEQIYGLVDISVKDKNYIAQRFLDWFVTEQLEEISKMSGILSIIQKTEGNLFLAERVVREMPVSQPDTSAAE